MGGVGGEGGRGDFVIANVFSVSSTIMCDLMVL